MDNPRISIVIPCWGRPARTRRIINNVLSQTINNWEAFIIGDGCPHFENMIESHEVAYFKKAAEEGGNLLHCYNLKENGGGFGHHIVNDAVSKALGKYFIFAGNDDILLPNHFEHYLSEIENTDLDLVYYNTYVGPTKSIRNAQLKAGSIGHSELIIRTDFMRDIQHDPKYSHDWRFIEQLINKQPKHKKAQSTYCTYVVTHIHHYGKDYSIDQMD
jgi:glycosyltransferase involved in cell wall biosynthesis